MPWVVSFRVRVVSVLSNDLADGQEVLDAMEIREAGQRIPASAPAEAGIRKPASVEDLLQNYLELC